MKNTKYRNTQDSIFEYFFRFVGLISIALLLGVLMMINTAIWFSLVALFFTQAKIRVLFERYQKIFNVIFGILLIAIAIKIIFT